jgi:hypothetical protein
LVTRSRFLSLQDNLLSGSFLEFSSDSRGPVLAEIFDMFLWKRRRNDEMLINVECREVSRRPRVGMMMLKAGLSYRDLSVVDFAGCLEEGYHHPMLPHPLAIPCCEGFFGPLVETGRKTVHWTSVGNLIRACRFGCQEGGCLKLGRSDGTYLPSKLSFGQ